MSCSSGTCLKRIQPLGDIGNNIPFDFHFMFMLLQAVSWQAMFPLCREPCSQSQLIKMISPPYKRCSCLPSLNFSHLVFILLLISCRHCFVCAMALFYQLKGNLWWSIIRTLLPGLLWHNFSHGIGEDGETGADGNHLNQYINWTQIAPTEECTWTVQPRQPCSRGLKGVLLYSAFPCPPTPLT